MILSPASEDYLKTIYKLRESEEAVTTQALADRLNVVPPWATAMIKKLASMKMVRHEKYRGVELMPVGEKIALEVIRYHRLIETYLTEVLGVAWDKVHDEAERWEHVLSEEVEAKKAEALNHPLREFPIARRVLLELSRANLIQVQNVSWILSDSGKSAAQELVHRHRVYETFLGELGYADDHLHSPADRVEHHLSPQLTAAIDTAVGNPTVDPHGKNISHD